MRPALLVRDQWSPRTGAPKTSGANGRTNPCEERVFAIVAAEGDGFFTWGESHGRTQSTKGRRRKGLHGHQRAHENLARVLGCHQVVGRGARGAWPPAAAFPNE